MKVEDDLIGTTAAGRVLGVSGRQILNLISDGLLPARKVGRDYLIARSDLEKVPVERKPGPKPKTSKPKKRQS